MQVRRSTNTYSLEARSTIRCHTITMVKLNGRPSVNGWPDRLGSNIDRHRKKQFVHCESICSLVLFAIRAFFQQSWLSRKTMWHFWTISKLQETGSMVHGCAVFAPRVFSLMVFYCGNTFSGVLVLWCQQFNWQTNYFSYLHMGLFFFFCENSMHAYICLQPMSFEHNWYLVVWLVSDLLGYMNFLISVDGVFANCMF